MEPTYREFRRIIEHPHWCAGDPLLWETRDFIGSRVGIADLARQGEVGKFNLAWWLLATDTPPTSAAVYRAAPLGWAIAHAPTLTLSKVKLTDIAAVMPLKEFNKRILRLLDSLPPEGHIMLAGYGVNSELLRRLAERTPSISL